MFGLRTKQKHQKKGEAVKGGVVCFYITKAAGVKKIA